VGGHLGWPEPPPTWQRSTSSRSFQRRERWETSLAGRIVQALFEASDGRIWVGTQQGDLAIIDPATGQGLLLDDAR
jgi:ligand-binding sensor domain-containing protein